MGSLGPCFLGFSVASVTKIYKMAVLKQKIALFEKKMQALDEKTKSLNEDLESSEDPIWLELALMEELGVIPEGAIKINYPEDP